MKKILGRDYSGEYVGTDTGVAFDRGDGPVAIYEAQRVDTDNARQEYVTECNSCSYYNRGECGRTGLESHPADICSRAVTAEA